MPLFLWLLPFIAIPLIITLLNRRKIITLDFSTLRFLKLLESEGFSFVNSIDIFDGGPKLICPIDNIRLIRESHHVVVTELNEDIGADDTVYLIANKEFGGFRVVQSVVRQLGDGQVSLTPAIATKLGACVGDALIISPLYVGKR